VRQIYNGVDQDRFRPLPEPALDLLPDGFAPPGSFLVGTVGRLAEVKDQVTLIRAFARLLAEQPDAGRAARLVIVGDGPMRGRLQDCIRQEGVQGSVWLAGDRDDVPRLLGSLDLFVLPSLGEGISNTILEAMACALPVIATRVGGNPELVEEGVSGTLVPPGDAGALSDAMAGYLLDPSLGKRHGGEALTRVVRRFRWERCVAEYLDVYDGLLGRRAAARDANTIKTGL
jgi:glycosyltransferase involved in cell wall biosynthesis